MGMEYSREKWSRVEKSREKWTTLYRIALNGVEFSMIRDLKHTQYHCTTS